METGKGKVTAKPCSVQEHAQLPGKQTWFFIIDSKEGLSRALCYETAHFRCVDAPFFTESLWLLWLEGIYAGNHTDFHL